MVIEINLILFDELQNCLINTYKVYSTVQKYRCAVVEFLDLLDL